MCNCGPNQAPNETIYDNPQIDSVEQSESVDLAVILNFEKFSREKILQNLKEKRKQSKPFSIHFLVPLCDNENQGIVPVNKQLGDGLNLKTNLYWGAGYGIKTYLLMTTNLLAPEAYVIGNCIDAWAKLQDGAQIRLSTAKGYNQYQKCGINGAKRLFQTGWNKI